MTTLTHALPALTADLRPSAAAVLTWVALLPLALWLRASPRAVLAAIPGGPAQADLGFGLGRQR
jgi:hypothetical protein